MAVQTLVITNEMPSNAGAFSQGAGGALTASYTNDGTYMAGGIVWGKRGSLAGSYTLNGVTYGGVSMNIVASIGTDSDHCGIAIVDIVNPPVGANDIVTNVTANTVDAETLIIAGMLSVRGQAPTPKIATQTTITKRESSATTTALATPGVTKVGNIVVWLCGVGSTFTAGAGGVDKTESWRRNVNTVTASGNGMLARTAGTGAAITCTFSHGSDWGQIACIEIAAAVAGVPYVANAAAIRRGSVY